MKTNIIEMKQINPSEPFVSGKCVIVLTEVIECWNSERNQEGIEMIGGS